MCSIQSLHLGSSTNMVEINQWGNAPTYISEKLIYPSQWKWTARIFSHFLKRSQNCRHAAFKPGGNREMLHEWHGYILASWIHIQYIGYSGTSILEFKHWYGSVTFISLIGTSYMCTNLLPTNTQTHTHRHCTQLHAMHLHPFTTDTPFFPLEDLSETAWKSEYLSSAHPACLVVHGVIW